MVMRFQDTFHKLLHHSIMSIARLLHQPPEKPHAIAHLMILLSSQILIVKNGFAFKQTQLTLDLHATK
jgi:hypothetical protein